MDSVQILDVGEPVTVGAQVTRELTEVGEPVPALVQHTTLENAVESISSSAYSVKVRQGQALTSGQAVRVLSCVQEPTLVGKVLLLDKVSENGAAVLRKAVASDWETVNQQGKSVLA